MPLTPIDRPSVGRNVTDLIDRVQVLERLRRGAGVVTGPIESFDDLARQYGTAYWKLAEELGDALDELGGHYDLTPSGSGLTRAVNVGPKQPPEFLFPGVESPIPVGVDFYGGTMTSGGGTPGPKLYRPEADLTFDPNEPFTFATLVVIYPPPADPPLLQKYAVAGCYVSDTPPLAGVRWMIGFFPVNFGTVGSPNIKYVPCATCANLSMATGLSDPPLLASFGVDPGFEFDMGLTYDGQGGATLYFNGVPVAQDSASIPSYSPGGIFQLGSMNMNSGLFGSWWNFHGLMGTAMLAKGLMLTSDQMFAFAQSRFNQATLWTGRSAPLNDSGGAGDMYYDDTTRAFWLKIGPTEWELQGTLVPP